MMPQDRSQDRSDEERMDSEAGKPPAAGRDHPNKPFRTPSKNKTHPAPEIGTDGHKPSQSSPSQGEAEPRRN